MEILRIKENINQLLKYAKNHTAEETENFIEELFYDEVKIEQNINQAYYKMNTKNYLINNGNGLKISINKGLGDILEKNHSHQGITISIGSEFLQEYEYLYDANEYNNNIDISHMIDNALENENILLAIEQYFAGDDVDLNMYHILSQELKDNQEIIDNVIKKIDLYSRLEHENQKNYEDISPNGGLDIIVQPVQEIFLQKLNEIDVLGNEKLVAATIDFFVSNQENIDYLSSEIDRCERILYFAEHADEYMQNKAIECKIINQCKLSNRIENIYSEKLS